MPGSLESSSIYLPLKTRWTKKLRFAGLIYCSLRSPIEVILFSLFAYGTIVDMLVEWRVTISILLRIHWRP